MDEKQVSGPVPEPVQPETTELKAADEDEDKEGEEAREEEAAATAAASREAQNDTNIIEAETMEPSTPTPTLTPVPDAKSESRNSNSASPRSHRITTTDEPEIHPELTLRQLQNPAEGLGRRPGSRSHAMTSSNGFVTSMEPLEINEMFDFCGRRSRSRLRDVRDENRTPWESCAPPTRQRRSSVAVMAGPVRKLENRPKYFTPVSRDQCDKAFLP